MLIPENFYVDNLSLPYFILISLFTISYNLMLISLSTISYADNSHFIENLSDIY